MSDRIKWICIFIILCIAFILRFHDLGAVEYICDEPEDIPVALAFFEQPNPFDLQNSQKTKDPTQAILPFYIGSTVFWLGLPHKLNWSLLWYTRIPFAFIGWMSVIMVYFLGRELYGTKTGVLGAFLLAISTYHVGFSRCAITTGDVCVCFFTITSLLLFFRGIKEKNLKYLLSCAIVAGLACASKFSAFLLVVVFFLFFVFLEKCNFFKMNNMRVRKNVLFITILNVVMIALLVSVSTLWYKKYFNSEMGERMLRSVFLVAVVYVTALLFFMRKIKLLYRPEEVPVVFFNMVLMCIICTFFASPIHLKPELFLGALKWFMEFGYNSMIINEQGSLFNVFSIIALRMGFPINVLLLSGGIYIFKHRSEKSNALILIALFVYLTFFISLRFILSWYLMPIIPLIIIVCAKQIVLLFEIFKQKRIRTLFVSLFCISILGQIINLLAITPYYHLDGYKWGRQFVGYNKPSFTHFEGIKGCIDWLEKHIPDNSTVGYIVNAKKFISSWGADGSNKAFWNVEIYSKLYSVNDTILYKNIRNLEESQICDYVIVSSIYGRDLLEENKHFVLSYRVQQAGLELYKIYKRIGSSA